MTKDKKPFFKSRTFVRFFKRKTAVFGLVVVLFFVVVALLSSSIMPYDPSIGDRSNIFAAPSMEHWFGTDDLGRDILSRMIQGTAVTVQVGFISVMLSLVAGTILGLCAGFIGGYVDTILTTVIEAVQTFPMIILAMTINLILGPGMTNVIISIGITFTPNFARVVRGVVLSIKETDYVRSAVVIGLNKVEILVKHVLPNCMSVIIVQTSLGIANAILSESSMSFLGMGIQAPVTSWGSMLKTGFTYLSFAPWYSLFPGFALFLIIMGLNFLGDGLRDALDVRIKTD